MTGRLSAHGLSVALVPGWDVQILRRDESALLLASPDGDVPVGGYTLPMIHAATITMPPLRGDYGSHVVPILGHDDVFIAMVEFGAESVGAAMFRPGFPVLRSRDFDPEALQRALPDRSGTQRFFTVAGRAFGLFCVIGSHLRRARLTSKANELLAGIEVDPA
ncbi:MAG: hypothetical protein V9E99_18240 [Microthrixaceae bacterium]